jgi:release factor glutamine methyltransferase
MTSALRTRSTTVHTSLRAAQAVLSTTVHSPALDAELLLAHVLGRDRSHLHAYPELRLTESQREHFDALLERRCRGEPIAYIVGMKEFWSLPLRVTSDVLIPRPETELLVALALARIPADETLEIADLGTGSGAIALAIAKERPHCKITASDSSSAALALAAHNAQCLGLTNVRFLLGEWFTPLWRRFDLIVSNPPYVAADDPQLHEAVLKFEPKEALISPAAGLHDLELIARRAKFFLNPRGALIVEHAYNQGAQVRELLEQSDLRDIETHRDAAGLERATLGHRSSGRQQGPART